MPNIHSPKDVHKGAEEAIAALYRVSNGLRDCRQCKGRSRKPVVCRDPLGHYNIHFFHVTNFLTAMRDKAAAEVAANGS